MLSYEEAKAAVLRLIKEPEPVETYESITCMGDVLAKTLAGMLVPDVVWPVGSWDKFNTIIGGGVGENQFTIICGPTGAGKTTLLANMASQLVSTGVEVFVASVEIGSERFMRKVVSIVTGKTKLESAEEIGEAVELMGSAFNTGNSIFANYDSRVPHLQLLADIYAAHEEFGTKVVLVDNLNFLMDVTDSRQTNTQMDRAIHDFVVFCKKMPIHVVMVMHPRKTENGRVETEFDIKGSSTAVQEASNVLLFNKIQYDKDAPLGVFSKHCREIKFIKLRNNGKAVGMRVVFALDEKSELYREGSAL